MAQRWPLIGRTDELRYISVAARSGAGSRGVVISGGAGVGKTSLAREAVRALGFRGDQVRWITGTVTAQSIPMGALMSQIGISPLADVSKPDGPAVVVVDDAHLLDHVSALLVHQIALRDAAIVLATVRTGEPVPDAITAIWKDGLLDRLDLPPLSDMTIADLLNAVLGGAIDRVSLQRFTELVQGNALYLRLLIEGERLAGRLNQRAGIWMWEGGLVLSPSLAELVASRMGSYLDSVRSVLDMIALAEPLPAAILRDLTSGDAVEKAERLGLVRAEQRPDGEIQIQMTHPLYSEAQRQSMGSVRARRIRGVLASALATRPNDDDLIRSAVLLLDSDLPPDAGILTAAAQQALARQDPLLSQPLARAAIAAGGGFDAQVVLAYSQTLMPGPENPDLALLQLSESAETDSQRAQVARLRAGNLFFTLQRPVDAIGVLNAAAHRIDGDSDRAGVRAAAAVFLAFLGESGTAIEEGETYLARIDLDDHAAMMAAWGVIVGLGQLGRADDIGPAVERAAFAAGRSTAAAALAMPVANGITYTLAGAGLILQAHDAALGLHHSATRADEWMSSVATANQGIAELHAGRIRKAKTLLRQALLRFDADPNGWFFTASLWLTQALALAGDSTAARTELDRMHGARHPGFAFLDPAMLLSEAWTNASEGATSVAVAYAQRSAQLARDRGQPGQEVAGLQAATCLGDRSGANRLVELAAFVQGPRVAVAARHAMSLAAADSSGLLTASVDWERMGDLVAAADAAAQASTSWADRGYRGSALSAAARAERLARECEGLRTPALANALSPLPLTAREREIVSLAAAGHSNRNIAERLFISVRTVEGHLYRAGVKLGATERSEFARILKGD